MIVCWIGYDQGSPHAHWIYWLEMQSITAERNVRFTADFTTVYTSPRPVHNQQLAAVALSVASQPVQQATPVQQPQPSQPPQLPSAMSSREEEVEVEDKLKDSNLPAPSTLKVCKGKATKAPPTQPTHQSAWLWKSLATI